MTESRRSRYQLRDPQLQAHLDAFLEEAGATGPKAEYIRQLMVTAVRLWNDGAGEGDLKLLNNALKELRHAMRVFAPFVHSRKVAVFGSARTPSEHPEWLAAHRFAERMAERGWMVITGAGDGIMGAAQGGAGADQSFGVNIRLPFEQSANDVIAGDHKLINFRYFFTRKVTFVKESHAIALFPGGFGTLDEGFEALTLIQTGKSEIVPVFFVDAPGGTYWKDLEAWMDTHLRSRGLISADDPQLYRITDDPDEAGREIDRFYHNYHSSRWVGDRLVLRLRRAPDGDTLAKLSDEFRELLAGEALRVGQPLSAEAGEVPELPRLVLRCDRRRVGTLRVLIDRLNDVREPDFPSAEASPHQIVALELPERAREEEIEDDGI